MSERLKRAKAPLTAMAALAVAAGAITLLGGAAGLRFTRTDSAAPAGLYRLVRRAPVRRGELVAACLPRAVALTALARGYLGAGACAGGAEPVAKLAGALPGDAVELESDRVAVDGARLPHSRTARRDSLGRPLAHAAWGHYRVGPGQVWLFGFNNPRSWDARYFGPVPLANVLGVLAPVLTYGK